MKNSHSVIAIVVVILCTATFAPVVCYQRRRLRSKSRVHHRLHRNKCKTTEVPALFHEMVAFDVPVQKEIDRAKALASLIKLREKYQLPIFPFRRDIEIAIDEGSLRASLDLITKQTRGPKQRDGRRLVDQGWLGLFNK